MKTIIKVDMDSDGNAVTELNGKITEIQPAIVYVLSEFIKNHPDKHVANLTIDECVKIAKKRIEDTVVEKGLFDE